MSKWETLIIGPRGCGKSKMAEQRIEAVCIKPLYIGTLPLQPKFLSRIVAHQTRRNASWSLVENNASSMIDLNRLAQCIREADGMLLDGVSVLLWNLVCFHGMDREELKIFVMKLLDILAVVQNKPSLIVDCEIPFPNRGRDYWFNQIVSWVHIEIKKNCNDFKILT